MRRASKVARLALGLTRWYGGRCDSSSPLANWLMPISGGGDRLFLAVAGRVRCALPAAVFRCAWAIAARGARQSAAVDRAVLRRLKRGRRCVIPRSGGRSPIRGDGDDHGDRPPGSISRCGGYGTNRPGWPAAALRGHPRQAGQGGLLDRFRPNMVGADARRGARTFLLRSTPFAPALLCWRLLVKAMPWDTTRSPASDRQLWGMKNFGGIYGVMAGYCGWRISRALMAGMFSIMPGVGTVLSGAIGCALGGIMMTAAASPAWEKNPGRGGLSRPVPACPPGRTCELPEGRAYGGMKCRQRTRDITRRHRWRDGTSDDIRMRVPLDEDDRTRERHLTLRAGATVQPHTARVQLFRIYHRGGAVGKVTSQGTCAWSPAAWLGPIVVGRRAAGADRFEDVSQALDGDAAARRKSAPCDD